MVTARVVQIPTRAVAQVAVTAQHIVPLGLDKRGVATEFSCWVFLLLTIAPMLLPAEDYACQKSSAGRSRLRL